jgi:hypothetical protein
MTSSSRIGEHLVGVVASASEKGLKLASEPEWRNFSRYASPPITPPARGAHVRLGLDGDGFVRELEVLDQAAMSYMQSAPTMMVPRAGRQCEIRRLACAKAAATFCAARAVAGGRAALVNSSRIVEQLVPMLRPGAIRSSHS